MRSEEIQRLLQRRVNFDCNRYFREGWNFFKFNCCVLFSATVVLTVIAVICTVTANAAGYAIAAGQYYDDYSQPTYMPPPSPYIPPYYPPSTSTPHQHQTYYNTDNTDNIDTTAQPTDQPWSKHERGSKRERGSRHHDKSTTTSPPWILPADESTATTTSAPWHILPYEESSTTATTATTTNAPWHILPYEESTAEESTASATASTTSAPWHILPFDESAATTTTSAPWHILPFEESATTTNAPWFWPTSTPADPSGYRYDGYYDDGFYGSGSVSVGYPRHYHHDEFGANVIAACIGGVMMILFGYPLAANCFLAVFNAMRGNTTVRFGDVFTSLSCRRYCRILCLGLLLTLFRCLLTLCFIIPGVWFSIVSAFAIPVFADRGVGACASIRISKRIIHKNFCSFLGFLILLALLQAVGTLCLFVGLFVTIPVGFVSFCYCYHHLFGVNGLEHSSSFGDSESDAPIPPLARPVQVVPVALSVSVADPIAPPPPVYNPQPPAPMQYNPQPAVRMQYHPSSAASVPVPVSVSPPQYIPTAIPVYPHHHQQQQPATHAHAYYPHEGVQMQPVVMHAIPVQFAPHNN